MLNTPLPSRCMACGAEQEVLAPVGTPTPIETVCPHCTCGLILLARREEAQWVVVATCLEPDDCRRFLPISNLDEELLAQLNAAGRTILHGDVYEADQSQVVREGDEAITRSHVARKLREGIPGFRLTRDHLKDERLFTFLERILQPSQTSD